MKNNYRFNQNNQQPYRVAPWTQQNSPSNPWAGYSNNSQWTPYQTQDFVQRRRIRKEQYGKDGQRLNGSQKRKRHWRAKIAKEKQLAADALPKGILMAIVLSDFPPKTMSTIELDKVQAAVLKEIDKIDPDGFRPQFLTSFKRRGMFMISCNNPESVDWLKTTTETLEPWEDARLKVVDSNDLPVYKNILITIPDSTEEPEKILKRLEHQNVGLQTETWHVIHHKVDETNVCSLKVSVDESVISTFEKLGLKLFLNFSRVEVKVLGKTGDGVKNDIGKVGGQKVETKDMDNKTSLTKGDIGDLPVDQSKMEENGSSMEDQEGSENNSQK